MSVIPRRRFWLLAAVVLPTVNVVAIAVFLFGGGDGAPALPVIVIAAEFALLVWLLARDGLVGGRLAAWLAAGTASTLAATVAYAFAAFLVWMAIVSAGCPAGDPECPF
jgi:hypothetical protein